MAITVQSIHLGPVRDTVLSGDMFHTAIEKVACKHAEITTSGLSGDGVGNPKHHGGPDQAVYVMSRSDLDALESRAGVELPDGIVGENITVDNLDSAQVRVGDLFHVGGGLGTEVILEATAPRIPCRTLAARVGDPSFKTLFGQARRPGIYTRVIQGGPITVGTAIEWHPVDQPLWPTMGEMVDIYYDPAFSPERLREILDAPVAVRARELYNKRLRRQG